MSLIYLPIRTQQVRCPLFTLAVIVILTGASSAARDQEVPDHDVQIVADDLESRTSVFVTRALNPLDFGKRSSDSGIKIHVVATEDFDKSVLKQSDVVYLLDVKRLDQEAVDALKDHVRKGAGLCIFLGPRADREFYRQLATEKQEHLMPGLLSQEKSLARNKKTTQPDLASSKHPAFRLLLDEKTVEALVGRVRIEKYHGISAMWDVTKKPNPEIAVRLRNGDPLVISHTLGNGRTLVILTSPNNEWHNWTLNPTWVVMTYTVLDYLAPKNSDGE